MRRRRFLAVAGTGTASILTGCTAAGLFDPDTEPSHPFADTTTRVVVDDRSSTSHDLEQNTWEALTFWEAHSPQYTGFDLAFEIVESSPNLLVQYVDDPAGCRGVTDGGNDVLGCAPLVTGERPPERPIPIRVVAGGRPYGQIRITTQHEIGHTLGLDHDDKPRSVMSDEPEDRIPMYDHRVGIWEQIQEAQEISAGATWEFDHGTNVWEKKQYGDALSYFGTASDSFARARSLVLDASEAAEAFETASQLETIDLPGLRTRLERISSRLALAVSFSRLMERAACAAVNGYPGRANSRLDAANDDIRAFHEIEPPTIREIAAALGLVRGLDQTGSVISLQQTGF